MSVFCFDEDPCHAKPVILEGARLVVSVCKMVKDGCSVAMRIDPFRYLVELVVIRALHFNEHTLSQMFCNRKKARVL